MEKCMGKCGVDACKYWICRLENPTLRKYFRERAFVKKNLEELAKRAELKMKERKPVDATTTTEPEKESIDADDEKAEEIEE